VSAAIDGEIILLFLLHVMFGSMASLIYRLYNYKHTLLRFPGNLTSLHGDVSKVYVTEGVLLSNNKKLYWELGVVVSTLIFGFGLAQSLRFRGVEVTLKAYLKVRQIPRSHQ
jgi:hypothetical protein